MPMVNGLIAAQAVLYPVLAFEKQNIPPGVFLTATNTMQ